MRSLFWTNWALPGKWRRKRHEHTPPICVWSPLEEEEEPVEVELEISPRDLAVMAASVCAALAAFWWLWKRLVK